MPDLAEFVRLQEERRKIESTLDSLKEILKVMEEEILGEFERTGMSSAKVDGMTIYLHRQLWAGPKEGDYATACRVMKENGLGDFVSERFNTNTVSAWVREEEKSGRALPAAIAAALNVEEKFTIKTRKGA